MGGGFQYAVACYGQPKLMDSFQHGGGVPFSDFGSDIVEAIERLFRAGYETWVAQEWIPAVPDIHLRLTDGGEAAEIGCVAGQCLVPVAMAYPNSASLAMTSIGSRLNARGKKPCAREFPTASLSNGSPPRSCRTPIASTS